MRERGVALLHGSSPRLRWSAIPTQPGSATRIARRPVVDLQCTAVFRRVPEGYIAFIEEFPGANTQGASLEEARTNLREAVALVIEANRELAREDADGETVIREPITVTA